MKSFITYLCIGMALGTLFGVLVFFTGVTVRYFAGG